MGARFGDLPCGLEFAYTDKFEAIKKLAVDELRDCDYDLIWYEHTHSYRFIKYLVNSLGAVQRPKIACNGHNVEWLLYHRMSKVSEKNWGAQYAGIQAQILRKLEAEQFKVCDLVFVCSDVDKQAGLELSPGTNFAVVGNGVDSRYFTRASNASHAKHPTLLFTGSFGYEPNLDGLKYFLDEIFPLIQAEVPTCRFVFAGRDAQTAFEGLQIDNKFVQCVSSPDDMRPCFQQAWIFVVPLRSGGGTRLKILEAMSMECPVVSTIMGAEGIPAEDGRHFLLADSSDRFAAQVLTLINEPLTRSQIAEESSAWVRQFYDWERLSEKSAVELSKLF
jgi:glycosyltransferase involved in cell wall biosynthesis